MIVSRTIAKKRIDRQERPAWFAAWGLVAVDFLLFCAYVLLIMEPLAQFLYANQTNKLLTFAIMVVVVFIPMQIVLIVSSLWASKSRFQDTDA